MDISNLVYVNSSKDDFYYPFPNNKKLYFVKDSSLDYDTAKISIEQHPVYLTSDVIYYNFSPYSFLTSFPSQLPQIYEGYISSGTFTLPDKSPGSWAVYSPTAKAYFLKFSYIFSLKKDYSKLATCQHLTSSGNLINAENYHYANKSKGAICSHPTMIKSNEGKVSYCSMILDHPAACPMFQEDKKLISSYKVSSKHSDSSHVISSYVARFLDQIHIFVENSQNQEQIFNVRLSNIDDISYDQILSEADVLINEALTAYPSTFFQVEKEEINSSVSVSLSPKKSYISSLV